MKILHIAPSSTYNDNWGYQENLLPKYQKKIGNEVALIVNTFYHAPDGRRETSECDYFLNDGVRVIRKKKKNV